MSRAALALALAALALTGCETTAEKSAKLEKQAKARAALEHNRLLPLDGRSVTPASRRARITAAVVLHDSEGAAAVVALKNLSSRALRDVPIEITARDARGATLYTNTTPGLSPALVEVASLPAHGSLDWVDDQVHAAGAPVALEAQIGEGEPATAPLPALAVDGHLAGESEGAAKLEGEVFNHSSTEQRELVVFCVASRGGQIVAAGRAVLAQVPPRVATHFQIFFVGDPAGAVIRLSAPATSTD